MYTIACEKNGHREDRMDFARDIAAFEAQHSFREVIVDGIPFRVLLGGEGEHTLTLLPGGMGLGERTSPFCRRWSPTAGC